MKKSGIIRAISAVSAAVLLVGCMAGCGGGGKSGDDYVYVPTFTELPSLGEGMNSVSISGDRIYFTASVMQFEDGTPLTEAEAEEYNEYWNNKYADAKSAVASVASDTNVPDSSDEPADDTAADDTAADDSKYENVRYAQQLRSIKLDGTDLTSYPDYVSPAPSGDYSGGGLNNIAVDSEGSLWVLENYYSTVFNMPDGLEPTYENVGEHYDDYYDHDEQTYTLKKLSSTGAVEITVDLTDMAPENLGKDDYYYISTMAADKKGNIILADSEQNIGVYGINGEFKFIIPVEGYVNSLPIIKDEVYVQGYGDDGSSTLSPIDIGARSLGKAQNAPDAWNFMPGGSKFDFSYTNGDSLYGYKFGDESPTKILSWLDCDMNGDNIVYSTLKDNDDVLAIVNDYIDEKNICSIVNLAKTPASEVTRKETLTMACMYTDYDLRAKILAFNKSDAAFRIEIDDYSAYNTNDDYTKGLTKLNTEIISGHAPDIIAIDDFSYDQYAAKGLLEDLYTHMDSGDVSKDDFVPSVIKALESDGKLYSICTSFTPVTLVGNPDLVGSEPGWTIQEMQDIISQNPNVDYPFGYEMSRDQILTIFLSANYENYIDWTTGKCSFDSDEFKSLLTFAAQFPSMDSIMEKYEPSQDAPAYISDRELLSTGRQLVSSTYLWDFNSIQDVFSNFGDKVVNKGFPSADRQGTVTSLSGSMAITSTCKNKDAAWQFISSLLTEDEQNSLWNGLPVNQKAFDAKLKEAMTQEYDENGNPISFGGWSDGVNEVNYYALTQAQADFILNIINSISRIVYDSDSAQELIIETVTPFFEGSKTVDQVCTELQSKMTMFVNEQR